MDELLDVLSPGYVAEQVNAAREPIFPATAIVRAKHQESAGSFPFLEHTKGKAWRFRGEEVAHELAIDAQPGQQRINFTHGVFPRCRAKGFSGRL
jgi:hypothetical protein